MLKTGKRGLYLLIALCCVGAIYFYPFLSSSIKWARNSHFRYEGQVPVKLPFRWVSGEGGGLHLIKPDAAFSTSVLPETSLTVEDFGPNRTPNDEARSRILHLLGFTDLRGDEDERTKAFTSSGLMCGRVVSGRVAGGTTDLFNFYCVSRDLRYTFNYLGREEYIPEAVEVAKQVVH